MERKMCFHGFARSLAAIVLASIGVAAAQGPVKLTHVHGLSYSPDGKQLMIPSHHGIAVYEGGRWSKAPGPLHDYMGFSATAGNIYSSGHPAPGSSAVNPFGLIRSRDGGKTWEKLGLEGETDFHLLATGWNTNVIYVWNPAPSARMPQSGLHFSGSDGFAWKKPAAEKLEGEPRALAVHPDDRATVAVATTKGIFLSRDWGEHFTPAAAGVEGLAVFFDLDGKHLWYGAFDGRPRLARVALADGKARQIALPPLERDAVSHIAQNPVRRAEYAIATFGRSVFISRDSAAAWKAIAERGDGK
ncbi:MAG: F510_1955 family glycosylhydrolase [Betaproteobacteria bacterium]